MDGIEIRLATPDDADSVERYHDQCFRSTFAAQLAAGEIRAPDREGTRLQLRGWFQNDSEFETRIAVAEGVPIGHITVVGNQLVHLFVEPAHHGIGLGKRLLELAEAIIAAGGHTHFELHTRVDNTRAIAFYEAAGWTMTGQRIHTVEHGISYDEEILVKQRP